MTIQEKFLTPNKYSRAGKTVIVNGKPVSHEKTKAIVLHWVGNSGQTAQGVWTYFESLKNGLKMPDTTYRYASAKYIIGLDGEIIQAMPDDEIEYAVGGPCYKFDITRKYGKIYPNSYTTSIEMCHTDWQGHYTSATIKSAKELVASLLNKFSLTIDDVYRHYDFTGKDCPRLWVNYQDEWDDFKNNIYC